MASSPPLRSDVVPSAFPPGIKTLGWMRLGEWGRALGLRGLARFAARRVEPLVAGQPFAQMWMAQTLAWAGHLDGALRAVCAAEAWPEGDARGYALLGFELRGMGCAKQAQALFAEAVARDSTDVDLWLVYIHESLRELANEPLERQALAQVLGLPGRVFERVGKLVELAERAVERAPNRADSHLVLGSCLSYLGRVDEARAAFQRASELEPEAEDAKQLLTLAEKARRSVS